MSTSVANASLKLSAHQAKHYINMQIRELNPLRELAVHSTMILNLLSNEVSVGLTDSEKALGNLLHQIEHNQNPRPTYIVNSGHGLHLYYIFKEPIKLYNHIKEPLKKMKFELTERLWNIFTSDLKEKQFQGIFQGFRMVGSPSKFGKEYRLRAFKTGK